MHQSGELEDMLEKAGVLVPPVAESSTDADGAKPPQGA